MQSIVMFFFFKQKTAYEMRISDWSSDVCSSDLSISTRRRRILLRSHPARAMVARARDRLRLRTVVPVEEHPGRDVGTVALALGRPKIGRASCRARACQYV